MLVQTVYTFSTDIGMKSGIIKVWVLVLKRGKVVKMEGVVQPDEQVMKEIEDHTREVVFSGLYM